MVGILPKVYLVFCPRCDKPFSSSMSRGDALENAKKHVTDQHPDYDPEWYDTYPTTEPNTPNKG